MTIYQMQSHAEWLSETFGWNLTQAADFVREIAAEAWRQGAQAATEDYGIGETVNPYLRNLSSGVNAGQNESPPLSGAGGSHGASAAPDKAKGQPPCAAAHTSRNRIAARLASARVVGCRHHERTCSRCLADAILPLLDETWMDGYRVGYESPDMPSDYVQRSPYHPDWTPGDPA